MEKGKKKIKPGLTVVEMLLVILIIGILVVIAIPNFISARENAKLRACVENMKMIESAVEQYAIHYHLPGDASPPTLDELYLGGYFKRIPQCPSGGTYSIEGDINSYIIQCDVHGSLNELAGNL